jgi:hypothetical protein
MKDKMMPLSVHPHPYGHVSEATKAVIFAVCVLSLLLVSLAMALTSGPIVLGTEMNTNGMVEYLCLGSGCENLHPMNL